MSEFIMEICHECLKLSILPNVTIRCLEHSDLPEGFMGAVPTNIKVIMQMTEPCNNCDGYATTIDAFRTEIEALQKREEVLVKAITSFVYETTCLSPQDDDGSHWCKISKETLDAGRAALKSIKENPLHIS